MLGRFAGPAALLDEDSNILWANDALRELCKERQVDGAGLTGGALALVCGRSPLCCGAQACQSCPHTIKSLLDPDSLAGKTQQCTFQFGNGLCKVKFSRVSVAQENLVAARFTPSP
jgi:hypothetical protein